MDKLLDKQTLIALSVALTAAISVGVATSTDNPSKVGAGDVQAVGGDWKITTATATDREASTWIEVTATNTGSEPARFVGIVQLQ